MWVADSPPTSGFSKRLFIRCPALPARIWSNIRCDGAMISEALRFAISMLELKEIRPYSVQTLSILGVILSWARAERQHKDSVTVDTMDLDVQLWLARKGTDENQLREIVKLTGSLARALLMVLHSLPRHGTGILPQKRDFDQGAREGHQSPQKRVRCYESFDVDTYRKFQEIVNLSTDKKEEVYTHRLESLLLDHPANSSPDSGVQEASVIDLLTGTKPANPITLQKVRSIISCQQSLGHHPSLTEEGRLFDSRLDVDVVDVIPLCKEAIDLGILEPRISQPKRKTRPRGEGHYWRDEVGKIDRKEYKYQSNSDPSRSRSIYVNYCDIVFPKGKDIGKRFGLLLKLNPPAKSILNTMRLLPPTKTQQLDWHLG